MANQVAHRETPVVIVGSGAAGLACALALAPTPVMVITKTATPAGGSSLLAQGGIAAALGPLDTPEQHAADTMVVGGGLAEPDRVGGLAQDGPRAIEQLIAAGLPVDRESDGSLALGREGAHSRHRIVHAGGDATGRDLVATLLAQVAQTPSIEILTETMAMELLTEGGRVTGLLAYGAAQGWIRIDTPALVLATGGLGALWQETTNPEESTADGLALAAHAGARLSDLEFVQFHPTALLPKGRSSGARLPLLTEALRGAGARLVDDTGTAIMPGQHPLGDLAPRDSVARAIWRQRAAGGAVFLDLAPALARHGEKAFPQAVALCRAAGYEPTAAPVPVTPAAHYHMGGVRSDASGGTSIPGLWVCGEIASTGVHGANRLASNSLLESLVFAGRAAEAIRGAPPPPSSAPRQPTVRPVPRVADREQLSEIQSHLRAVMSRHVGIVRQGSGLDRALRAIGRLQAKFDEEASAAKPTAQIAFQTLKQWSELRNMLLAGRLIALAAFRRAESRGAHFRADFPETRRDWAHRLSLNLADLDREGRIAKPGS